MENQVTVFDHPLIQHKLTHMRDEKTGSKLFRELVSEVSMLMCYEATRDLPLKEVEVQTPLVKTKSKVIAGRKLAFVPILRAGLGMLDAMLEMVPAAKVGHIGLIEMKKLMNLLNITTSYHQTLKKEMYLFLTQC